MIEISQEFSFDAAHFLDGAPEYRRMHGHSFYAEVTLRGEPVPEPPIGGYRLLLEGRFVGFPDGRTIHCQSPGVDAEPVCVAAAEVDRVAIEDASGKLLREWRGG